jgi:flagellar assembly protein FliH
MIAAGEDFGRLPFAFTEDFSDPSAPADPAEAAREAAAAERESAAYARGYDDGASAERAGEAARTAAALEQILQELGALQTHLESIAARASTDARALAFAFARKLAGRLVVADPLAPVAEAIDALLADLRGQDELIIRLNPALTESAEASLAPAIAERLPAIRLKILADETVAAGDCRLEWPTGGLALDHGALGTRLAALADQAVAAGTPERTIP